MKEQKAPLIDNDRLRQKAEDLIKKQPPKTFFQFTEEQLVDYIHEMEVRQLQLELQNDEIRHAWAVSEVSNLKYTELYDFAPLGYFTLSKNGKIVELNVCGSQMLGKELWQLENVNFNLFVSGDTQPIFNHFLRRVFNSKTKETCDVTLITNDRLPVFVNLSGIALNNEEQCHLVAVDITDRKQADELLEQTRRNYEIFFNAIDDFLFVLDEQGNIVHCNSTVTNRLGYAKEELFGKPVVMIHPPEQQGEVGRILGDMLSGLSGICQVPILTKSGIQIPVETSVNRGFWDKKPAIFGVTKDISKLKISEEKFSKLFHINPSACGLTDIVTNEYIEVNEAFYGLFGFEKDEVIGKTPMELGLVSKETIAEILAQVESEGITKNISADLIAKNGEIKHVLLSADEIYIEDKKYRYTVAHDITARKKAEDALRTSEDKFRSLIHYSGDPIFSFNPDETYQFVNQSFAKVFGLAPEDLLGKSPHFIFPYEEAEKRLTMVRKVLQTGKKDEIEVKVVAKTGEVLYFLTTLDPIKNEQGKILFVTCISKDITERKRDEIALRQSEEKFRLIAENTSDTIMVLDMDFNISYVSPSIIRICGYPAEEAILQKIDQILTPESLTRVRELFARFLSAELNEVTPAEVYPPVELTAYHKNDSTILVELSFSFLRDKDHKPTGAVTVLRDITARKISEAELIRAKEKAEESDRLKSAFLTNMSHEIRTPMNGILGFAGLLKEPNLTGEDHLNYIRVIEKSSVRMLNIINDIVDIAKIESGQVEVIMSESNINEQIDYVYRFFKQDVESKGIRFSYSNALPDREAIIETDREKLYAILINLVKNSVKFTDFGSIEFGYNVAGTQNSGPLQQLEFFVKDTGIGVRSDRQQAIFERFIQADIADKKAYQGAGLGLSISKAYVEMLGGKIWVESEEGAGSIFYFTIPFRNKNRDMANVIEEDKDEEYRNRLKILIAEDDETSEMFIATVVKKISSEVVHVKTGGEAVEACRNNPEINLVLMDINMPKMNGYEATRQIRRFNQNVIIIAQTAYGLSGDREKALNAGCNDYIAKPIRGAELLKLIRKHFMK